MDRFFVITGGPGSGKTALLEAMACSGVATMPEAGRAIISDQVAIGGHALPWAEPLAFAELMLSWEMRSYREAKRIAGPVLFDRGIPDVIGYLRLTGIAVPRHMFEAARLLRYRRQVFLAPHWPEIFAQDAERRQSAAEAEATCCIMTEIYRELGYDLLPLPLTAVAERAEFVKKHFSEIAG